MKKIYNKLPLFILLAFSLQGCAKLDQEPYVDLSEEKAFCSLGREANSLIVKLLVMVSDKSPPSSESSWLAFSW